MDCFMKMCAYALVLCNILFIVSVTVVIAGILMMLVGVIGNRGLCIRKKKVFYMYFGLLSCLIIINIAAGVMAFMWSEQMSGKVSDFYTKIYNEYPNTMIQLDKVHEDFECCGTDEPLKSSVRDTCPDISYPSCPSVIQEVFKTNTPRVLRGFLGMAAIMMATLVVSVFLNSYILQSPIFSPEVVEYWEHIHEDWIRDLRKTFREVRK
ncbi:hypothetical protein Q8A67_001557 [Cirrhinus molitorella]|uniref:Tetraspanin n=1 Tax=Cirrhinus molitorella TaxID=172907 RepID=A0AA88TYW2_9TELE|nr:hypothetical protein Q8A67_001557 [Cirrhinus molitorella]